MSKAHIPALTFLPCSSNGPLSQSRSRVSMFFVVCVSMPLFCDSGFNGQLRADLRCHWLLRSLALFSGLRRFHCSDSQTPPKSVTKVKYLRTVSLWWCFLVGLSSALLTSASKEHSMSGHVSFALQVSFFLPFFQCVLCAISCLTSQCTLFFVKIGIHPVRPLCFRPYNGGKVSCS